MSVFLSMLIAAINFHSVFYSQMICPRVEYCSTATINTQVIKCLIYMFNALWYHADIIHLWHTYINSSLSCLHACTTHKWLNFNSISALACLLLWWNWRFLHVSSNGIQNLQKHTHTHTNYNIPSNGLNGMAWHSTAWSQHMQNMVINISRRLL